MLYEVITKERYKEVVREATNRWEQVKSQLYEELYWGGIRIMATANIGFEEKLWSMADKLRGSMDAAEYKHVALGLLFLKYVS